MKKLLSLVIAVVSTIQLCSQGFTWSNPPTVLSTVGVNSSDPQVVIDESGNATALWIEGTTIKASSLLFGGLWGSPVVLSGTGATNPGLGIDGSGNVTAVWLEGGVVKVANLVFGGTWSSSTAISDTGASNPSIYVDNAGNAVSVWVRSGYIETATQLFGGSWGAVSMLSGTNSDNPAVAIGTNGTIAAVWHSVVSGQDQILVSVGGIGQAWNTPVTVIASVQSNNYPSVAVDSTGNILMLWFNYLQSGNVFSHVFPMSASLASGSMFLSQTTILDLASLRDPATLMNSLAFDGSGNAIALWTASYDGSSYNIITAEQQFGQSWSNPSALVLQSTYAYEGDVSVCPSGDASSVYMFFDGISTTMIQSSNTSLASNVTGFWSIPNNVSIGTQNAYSRIATSLSSGVINAAAIWVTNNGSNNVIVTSTGTRDVVVPATDVTISQGSSNQGVFIEYFNTVGWTASTDPDLQGYNIYRNQIYWTQIGSESTSIIDHNAVQGGSVTYGVAAFNSSQEQSAMATASFP